MRKALDQLVELALGGWGSLSYNSIFSMKYVVRSSPQSDGDLKRDKGMCGEANLLEKCNNVDELAVGSVKWDQSAYLGSWMKHLTLVQAQS